MYKPSTTSKLYMSTQSNNGLASSRLGVIGGARNIKERFADYPFRSNCNRYLFEIYIIVTPNYVHWMEWVDGSYISCTHCGIKASRDNLILKWNKIVSRRIIRSRVCEYFSRVNRYGGASLYPTPSCLVGVQSVITWQCLRYRIIKLHLYAPI